MQYKTELLNIFTNDIKTANVVTRCIEYNFNIIDTFIKILKVRPKNVRVKELIQKCLDENLLTQEDYDKIYNQEQSTFTPMTGSMKKNFNMIGEIKKVTPKQDPIRDADGKIKVSKMSPKEYAEWQEAQIKLFLLHKGLDEIPEYSPGGAPLNDAARQMEKTKEPKEPKTKRMEDED